MKLIGPTEEVIRAYYGSGNKERTVDPQRGVQVTSVTTHDGSGPRIEFESGGKVVIRVQAHARSRHEDMSLVIQIVDENQYPVFDTCTQRLGAGAITLDDGQSLERSFELDLSLAEGTFCVNAYLHRYLTDRPFDSWLLAATFFVTGAHDVRGIVNLHPKLLECQIGAAPHAQKTHDVAAK